MLDTRIITMTPLGEHYIRETKKSDLMLVRRKVRKQEKLEGFTQTP
jgi:hypothetical protein